MGKNNPNPQEVLKRLERAKAQGAGQANAPQIDPADCPDMLCVNCEGDTFIQTFSFKALSVFQQPPKGGNIQLTVVQCIQCGTPLNLKEAHGLAFKRQRQEQQQEAQKPKSKKALVEEKKDGKPVLAKDEGDTPDGQGQKNNKGKIITP